MVYGRGELWDSHDDQLLVNLTLKHNDNKFCLLAEFNERSHSKRGMHALEHRQGRLRFWNKLPPIIKKTTGYLKYKDAHFYTQDEAIKITLAMKNYWDKKGSTTHKFGYECISGNRFIIKSNLVNGCPPGFCFSSKPKPKEEKPIKIDDELPIFVSKRYAR